MASQVPCADDEHCSSCEQDLFFLTSGVSPAKTGDPVQVVDLFAGCGGMTTGLVEAARRNGMEVVVKLAIDSDEAALSIYEKNLRPQLTSALAVDSLFSGALGKPLTEIERRLAERVGEVDILVGGPPCQGHSDLNNHTRRSDPKNSLLLCMARAAEVLQPKVVIIENVPSVHLDRSKSLQTVARRLTKSGYAVSGAILNGTSLGVPQKRRRFILLASRVGSVNPIPILAKLALSVPLKCRTVKWAIHDLLCLKSKATFDTPSNPTDKNRKRMAHLFKRGAYDLPNHRRPKCHRNSDHSYGSVYGRLRWTRPAQTITTGFGCMGQGRYVHPQRRRTITPHEAARLQTFPDWFVFGKETKRSVLSKVIGNAVPPLFMVRVGSAVLSGLKAQR